MKQLFTLCVIGSLAFSGGSAYANGQRSSDHDHDHDHDVHSGADNESLGNKTAYELMMGGVSNTPKEAPVQVIHGEEKRGYYTGSDIDKQRAGIYGNKAAYERMMGSYQIKDHFEESGHDSHHAESENDVDVFDRHLSDGGVFKSSGAQNSPTTKANYGHYGH